MSRAVLIVLINLFARDARVGALTVAAVMCFLLNVSLCGKREIPKAIFHVLVLFEDLFSLAEEVPAITEYSLAERRARYVSVW